METFKWEDLQGAFGKFTEQIWNSFVNGSGQVWELDGTTGVRNGTMYNIITYRFITNYEFQGATFTFKIDVEDYIPIPKPRAAPGNLERFGETSFN